MMHFSEQYLYLEPLYDAAPFMSHLNPCPRNPSFNFPLPILNPGQIIRTPPSDHHQVSGVSPRPPVALLPAPPYVSPRLSAVTPAPTSEPRPLLGPPPGPGPPLPPPGPPCHTGPHRTPDGLPPGASPGPARPPSFHLAALRV